MNVTQDLSILHLIINASAVVQIVMAILAGVSVMSWYYIFMKWFAVRQARTKTEVFERDFWSGGDLNSLYNNSLDRTAACAWPMTRRRLNATHAARNPPRHNTNARSCTTPASTAPEAANPSDTWGITQWCVIHRYCAAASMLLMTAIQGRRRMTAMRDTSP